MTLLLHCSGWFVWFFCHRNSYISLVNVILWTEFKPIENFKRRYPWCCSTKLRLLEFFLYSHCDVIQVLVYTSGSNLCKLIRWSLDFPQIILDVEREELGISAGLQDRVVQTYEGLVFMDFTGLKGVYTKMDQNLLPPMYLAYNPNAGM